MSKLMISISGIRGIFADTLNPDDVLRMVAHFGRFLGKGKVVVGRDSRTTGPAMYHAIVSALISVGCDVVDIGIAATPTVLLAVQESDAVGGIAITASHNPAQWNAMKFVDSNGMFLVPKRAKEFISLLDNKPVFSNWENIGKIF